MLIDQSKEESPDAPEPTRNSSPSSKDQYGKVKIDEKAANDEKAQLGEAFTNHTETGKIQLQQAALLNQLYAKDVLAKKVEPTDDEVKALHRRSSRIRSGCKKS